MTEIAFAIFVALIVSGVLAVVAWAATGVRRRVRLAVLLWYRSRAVRRSMTDEEVACCVELPTELGETLIRHVDYEDFGSPHEGTRRIAGRIRSVSAVESPLRVEPSGSIIWYVTINVDGELVTLTKSAAEGDGPEGPGLWAACDDFAERVTGFSQNPNLWSGMNDWARHSRRCALL